MASSTEPLSRVAAIRRQFELMAARNNCHIRRHQALSCEEHELEHIIDVEDDEPVSFTPVSSPSPPQAQVIEPITISPTIESTEPTTFESGSFQLTFGMGQEQHDIPYDIPPRTGAHVIALIQAQFPGVTVQELSFVDETSNRVLRVATSNSVEQWLQSGRVLRLAVPTGGAYCPEGHALECSQHSYSALPCDKCEHSQLEDAYMMRCRQCVYDVCLSCAFPNLEEPDAMGREYGNGKGISLESWIAIGGGPIPTMAAVTPDITCKICYEMVADHRIGRCGHVMCKDCALHCVSSPPSVCPFCRMGIIAAPLRVRFS